MGKVMAKKRVMPADVEDIEKEPKESKFHNKRVWLTPGGAILKQDELRDLRRLGLIPTDGIVFDSTMEAEYYRDVLQPRELAGEIEVTLQPKFVLINAFEKDGVKYRPITYIPDFLATYPDGCKEAIDVKGMQTETFNLKRKLFDFVFPDIKLLVMKRVRKYGGWIQAEEYTARKKQERRQNRSISTSRKPRRERKWN